MSRRPLVPLLALAMLLAACSSSSGSGEAGTTAPATSIADSATTTTAPEEPTVAGELLVLSYNVAGLPEVLSGSEPEINTPLIGALLGDYDVVLLQESWKTPEPNPLDPLRVYHEILEDLVDFEHRSISAELPLGSDATRPEALLGDGLNRFSRVPFGEVTRERWEGCFGGGDTSDGGSGDCLALKGFSVATTTLADGVEVDIYNLHAEAGGTAQDQALQEADYDQLASFIEDHSGTDAIILAGDTNLHTDGVPDPENPEGAGDLEIWERFLDRTGLVDVCTTLGCDDADMIDKAASRSSDALTLEPTSREYATDVFVRDDGEPLSDHPPLVVNFAWSAN